MPTTITQSFRFEAAHYLRDPALSDDENANLYGPCARMHGHSYEIRVTIGSKDLRHGMVMDFSIVSALVGKEVLERFDHQVLNDLPELAGIITTSEELAQWIWNRLAHALDELGLDEQGVELRKVDVWETSDAWASVTGDEKGDSRVG